MKFKPLNMLLIILVASLVNILLAGANTPQWIQLMFAFLIGINSRNLGLPMFELKDKDKEDV